MQLWAGCQEAEVKDWWTGEGTGMAVEAGVRNPCVHGDFRAEQRRSGGPVLLCAAMNMHGNRPLFQCPPPGQLQGRWRKWVTGSVMFIPR